MRFVAIRPLRQFVDPAGDTSSFLLAVLACAFFGWLQTCKAVGYGLLKQQLAVAAQRPAERVPDAQSEHLPFRLIFCLRLSFLGLPIRPVFRLGLHPAIKQRIDHLLKASLIPTAWEIGAQLGGRDRNVAF